MHKVSKSIDIFADIDKCYQTICDFSTYPQWQKEIKSAQIVEKEGERPLVVTFTLQALLKKITYTLKYTYDDSSADRKILSWEYVKGDLKNIQGSYIFEKKSDKHTLAIYDLEVDLGIWAPATVINTFKKVAMKESMIALKKRAEQN